MDYHVGQASSLSKFGRLEAYPTCPQNSAHVKRSMRAACTENPTTLLFGGSEHFPPLPLERAL